MHHSPCNCFLLADLVHAWITSGVETTNRMHSNVKDKGRLFIAQSVFQMAISFHRTAAAKVMLL